MAVVDSIILVIIGAGALVGFIKGFVKQLATLLGLVAGLVAAKTLYASVAENVFSRITDSMTVAQVLAFLFQCAVLPGSIYLLRLAVDLFKDICKKRINLLFKDNDQTDQHHQNQH